ncbi:MAG: fatty acid oxidation complex subunit alpha FadB [Halobacteriovoraceae bacterium]|nr:fatty acid oxidation complex subunit alpha FadB [Halobacteriovoraceae bacterium]
MLMDGNCLQLKNENGVLHLIFDRKNESVNVFNAQTVEEFIKATDIITKQSDIRGLILYSAKNNFVMGADITEFIGKMALKDEDMKAWLVAVNNSFNKIEDLPYPTVSAITGFALGGGFEVSLSTTYRICTPKARVGLPETKLGIMPGWGGTVRLSRLIGADHAIEWIASGKQWKAQDAFKIEAVDAVVSEDQLLTSALTIIDRANSGELKWNERNLQKKSPLKLDKIESTMVFEGAKGFVAGMAGPHYPAPLKAVETIQKGSTLSREEALNIEGDVFVKLMKTPVAESLVRVFLGDQYLKKNSKKLSKEARTVKHAAVLGAGIMGGGIAYQSASSGIPILMKDIRPEAIGLGLNEATKLLGKQLERKKIDEAKMAQTLNLIAPTLNYGDFQHAQVIIEAVVENEKIKKSVLAEVENAINEDTVLTSNTSTISITKLAQDLKRPENFCGMHFFNPVHKMPLVEVIRGEKTSDETIATVVSYALQMGKTPIVVNDCPGFLVNRILFPYFGGLIKLLQDGVDFKLIDKTMEKFGWPMGPAYLLDVVGLDTASHALKVMGEGFPDRMKMENKTAIDVMYENNRYGQKNGLGFYEYTLDKKGKPIKNLNPEVYKLLKEIVQKEVEVDEQVIIERMMLPLIFETIRCLEDKIVQNPIEADMGLLLGLGFPPFRTGALKYADTIGLKNLAELSKKYHSLGNLYAIPRMLEVMISEGKNFY